MHGSDQYSVVCIRCVFVAYVSMHTPFNWPCSLTPAQVLRMEFTSADNAFMHNIAAFKQVRTAVVAYIVLFLPFD